MGPILSSHNKQKKKSNSTEYRCHCSNRDEWTLENKYLTPRIVYRADVTNNKTDEHKYYYGISDIPFKERYQNHKMSLTDIDHVWPLQICPSITGN